MTNPNLPLGYDPRDPRQVQAEADRQAATMQNNGTKIGSNPNAAAVEANVQTNFTPSSPAYTASGQAEIDKQNAGLNLANNQPGFKQTPVLSDLLKNQKQGPLVDQYGNPTASGILNQGSMGGENQTYNPTTGADTNTAAPPGSAQDMLLKSAARGEQRIEANNPQTVDQRAEAAANDVFNRMKGTGSTAAQTEAAMQAAKQTEYAKEAATNSANTSASTAAQNSTNQDLSAASGSNASNNAPPDMKAAATVAVSNAVGTTSFDNYLSTLSPDQQQVFGPMKFGVDSVNQALGVAMGQAVQTQHSGYAVADALASAQKDYLNKMSDKLDTDRAATQDFLKQQMDAKNQNLAAQRDEDKAWLTLNENADLRKAEYNKAQTVMNMAFSNAVSGAAFSSSAAGAVDKAEYEANRDIGIMQAQYGLKMADVDIKYTADYTNLNQTYMQGLFQAAKDYRDQNMDILGKQYASESDRAKAKLELDKNLSSTISSLSIDKATNMREAMSSVTQAIISQNQLNRQMDWNAHLDQRQQSQFEITKQLQLNQQGLQRQQALQFHTDQQTNVERSYYGTLAKQLHDDLLKPSQPVYVYSDTNNIHRAMQVAWDYNTQVQANPNSSDAQKSAAQASSDSMLTEQFSHIQNAGSIRIQNLGGELSQNNQSIGQKFLGEIDKVVNGGAAITPELRTAMKTLGDDLMNRVTVDAKKAVGQAWMEAQQKNAGVQYDQKNRIMPVQITDQPELLDGINQSTNKSADDWWNNGGSATGQSGGIINSLFNAHQEHEGFGSSGAPTITGNNNPGALRWNPAQAQFGGEEDPSGFTKFPDYQSGANAAKADLISKVTGNSPALQRYLGQEGKTYDQATLQDYVNVYAPTDDGNDPKGYAQSVVASLKKDGYNVSVNTPLSQIAALIGGGNSIASNTYGSFPDISYQPLPSYSPISMNSYQMSQY